MRVRDGADALFVRLQAPPLRVVTHGVRLRGFLRHRSFLASVGPNGHYEATLDELFAQALTPDAVVIDAGAHIGLYSLVASPVVASGRILAFEPDPYNLAALRVNVRAAGVRNVEIMAKALADEEGSAMFHASESTIGSSLVERTDVPRQSAHVVPVTTIDACLGAQPLARLVAKLDLEGAEPRALAGAEASIRRAGSVALFVEVHPEVLAQAGSSSGALVGQLRDLGLAVVFVDRDGGVHGIEDPDALVKGNLYASRGV